MIKKIFIVFTFVLVLFNVHKVEAKTIVGSIDEYGCKIDVIQVSELAKDKQKEGYYSVTYAVMAKNCKLIKYRIPATMGFPYDCYIANVDTGDEQRSFIKEKDGNRFKVMIPEDKVNTEFLGQFSVYSAFEVEVDFITYERKDSKRNCRR